jgi:ATP-dependent helicase/nuclease subunit A
MMNNENINKFSIQTSFAISAGAGSGKTYTLSRRFINILLGFDFFIENSEQEHFYDHRDTKKADLREIVTITYTEAAALEMKERIFGLIHKILHVDTLDVNDGDLQSIRLAYEKLEEGARGYIHQRLHKAMKEMGEATITTIHGFCLGVLKRNADVAKIDGSLEVYGDEDKQQLFQKVYFEIINDEAYQNDILSITQNVSLNKSITLIQRYVFEHKFRHALDNYFHGNSDKIKEILVNMFLEPLSDMIDEAREELKSDPKLPALDRFVEKAYAFEFESFNESADSLGVSKTLGAKKYPATTEVRDTIQGLSGYFSTIEAEKEEQFSKIIESFRKLLGLIKSGYDAQLRKEGVTDFDTIIQRAASIMEKIDTGFRYIMVDEFQDTNAIQWDIVKNAGKNANLFVVGDEKQSIYSFQGGEIEVFHNAIKERFEGKPVGMRQNFRSDRSIIQFVNDVFKSIFEPTDVSGPKRLIQNDYEASHQDLKSMSKKEGSVAFLVSRIDKKDEDGEGEATNLALFIKNIVDGDIYPDISEKIKANKPAIAVVYDAKSKMLDLKAALYNLGIECKVSKSENFYTKEEITDLFFVLKAIVILRKKPLWSEVGSTHRYHIAGALRSKILRLTDKEVHELFDAANGIPMLETWCQQSYLLAPHQLIQNLLHETDSHTAYAQLDNYEQRLANIESIISSAIAHESAHGYDLESFVYKLEQNIFHAQNEEEEAFYRSTTAGSIELCSIHATKGLAYPMVIVADSAKALTSQVTTEVIKFNNFKDTMGDKYNLVGFKLGEYEPISMRLLKEVDKRKHMAEKKRLYYVALTRAQNHLVISANLKPTNGGVGSINNSYLQMTLQAVGISKEELFEKETSTYPYKFIFSDDLKQSEPVQIIKEFEKVKPLEPITFAVKSNQSATSTAVKSEIKSPEMERASLRGTIVHKALELFWDRMDEESLFNNLFAKEGIDEQAFQDEIKTIARNFQNSHVYGKLSSGAQHLFEYRFDEEIEGEQVNGSIDLIYHDEANNGWVIVDFKSGKARDNHHYDEQLAFYRRVLEHKQISVIDAQLCWLG